MLGTSIARPLIAKRLIEIANETGADAISHGATGKGNDQVRFELGAYALKPGIKVIAPWREWDLHSRESLMAYCKERDIPVDFCQRQEKVALFHGRQPAAHLLRGRHPRGPLGRAEEDMWRWSVSPEAAPDTPTYIELDFEQGDIVAIDGEAMSPATVLETLNKVGGANGIGRDDIVENRYVGMKSAAATRPPVAPLCSKRTGPSSH